MTDYLKNWATTERTRAEAALRDADRHKDQFMAVLAHELRNGLTPLCYNVQIGNSRPGMDGIEASTWRPCTRACDADCGADRSWA